MQEYSIQRSQRRCHQSDRPFAPGEPFYSALIARGGELRRIDVAAEAWQGVPRHAVAWWSNRMPEKKQGKIKPAPPPVLIAALESLLEEGTQPELAYLLALLLVRRRILVQRSESWLADDPAADSAACLNLKHGSSQREFLVPICEPPLGETERFQDELTRLLFCDA
jgi:hypothetical protein